jgi:RNA polymerase sigma factor (sigma-70 family)
MSEQTDTELWRRVVDGDGDAFVALFTRHADAVANYAFRRTADWSAAEDVTSMVFLEAWRQRRNVQFHQESALPWLLGVGHNVVRTIWRSRVRHRRALSRIRIEVENSAEDRVAGRVDDERRMERIRELVGRLPAADRTVLELCAWAGLSYAEAALALGVPVGTIRSRLSRARTRLRDLEADALARELHDAPAREESR